jgi:hypothetical protein
LTPASRSSMRCQRYVLSLIVAFVIFTCQIDVLLVLLSWLTTWRSFGTLLQVDPSVSAAVHNVAALFAKARQDFSGYYRAALQYLCFVSLDDLPQDDQLVLARDISLAALLGDSVYSFAELLLHPLVRPCLLALIMRIHKLSWLSSGLVAFRPGYTMSSIQQRYTVNKALVKCLAARAIGWKVELDEHVLLWTLFSSSEDCSGTI